MTSIQHLSDRFDAELSAMQNSIGELRGNMAISVTQVRQDMEKIIDAVGVQHAQAIHRIDDTIASA